MTLTPLEPWIAHKIGQAGGSLDPEALRGFQLERLNDTLARAQTASRFYKRSLGSRPLRLTSLDDLAELPLTSPEDLRAAPLEFLCVAQHEVERIVTLPTSGTTGPAKRVFFSGPDQELTTDFFHYGMSTMVEPGDRVLILLPGQLPGSVGALLEEGLARMGVRGIQHGPVSDPRHTLAAMEEEGATALVGIPLQVLSLVRQAQADGLPKPSTLGTVLLSTDRLPHAVTSVIEQRWDCAVYDHYGSTEMGLGGGVDCRERTGYHLREADLLFEIVDPETGRPVSDGENGEVVFTTLTREAMPLIRYRTGDVSRFIPAPCDCGTVLRRMAHIDRRFTSSVTLPGGQPLSQGDLDEALLPLETLADFKALFAGDKDQADLVVRIRAVQGTPGPADDEVRQALNGIPPLADVISTGRLSLQISTWEVGGKINPGTAKRRIEDLQEAKDGS